MPTFVKLQEKYKNDFQFIGILFERDKDVKELDAFMKKYKINFPITVVEVNMSIGGTNINFKPLETTLGSNTIKGGLMSHCGMGLGLQNTGLSWLQNPIWNLQSRVTPVEGTNVIKAR